MINLRGKPSAFPATQKELLIARNNRIDFLRADFAVAGGYGEHFFLIPFLSATLFSDNHCKSGTVYHIFLFQRSRKVFPYAFNTIIGIMPNVMSTLPQDQPYFSTDNGSFFVLRFILPLLLARYSFKPIGTAIPSICAPSLDRNRCKDPHERSFRTSCSLCKADRPPTEAAQKDGGGYSNSRADSRYRKKSGLKTDKPGALTGEEFEQIKSIPPSVGDYR